MLSCMGMCECKCVYVRITACVHVYQRCAVQARLLEPQMHATEAQPSNPSPCNSQSSTLTGDSAVLSQDTAQASAAQSDPAAVRSFSQSRHGCAHCCWPCAACAGRRRGAAFSPPPSRPLSSNATTAGGYWRWKGGGRRRRDGGRGTRHG